MSARKMFEKLGYKKLPKRYNKKIEDKFGVYL